jgi:L-alanine-DL-glutamate epimerase-like enolase superfamily enzyme
VTAVSDRSQDAVGVAVDAVDVSAYTIPTDAPESDGTFAWDSTTMVVVAVHGGGFTRIGYSYAPAAAVGLVRDELVPVVLEEDALQTRARWHDLVHAVRNIGRPGMASYAVSAVDTALWDLKGRLLDTPLVDLLGARHEELPVYGSGGFTSYDDDRLASQLAGWVDDGITRVKMKVGRQPDRDVDRVRRARDAVGPDAELYVDANGAYTRNEALAFAERFADHDVTWLEEPVSSDDVAGLRLLRDRCPAGMDVTAGEYGTHVPEFRQLLRSEAVDCLQADVTRCGGITAIQMIGDLCFAEKVDLSAHTAPQLSAHAFSAVLPLRHLEWFHDHVRIERLAFDGVLEPIDGLLRPDRTRPGHGLELRQPDLEPYRVA